MDNENVIVETADTTTVSEKPKTPGKAIASLILGIASLLLGCCGSVGIVTGIISIILTCSLKKDTGDKNTMATVGMILGIVGIVISLIVLIVNLAMGGALFAEIMSEMSY